MKSLVDPKKKNKKGRQVDNFKMNIEDERFQNIYRQDFGIDPTNSKFKQTDNMKSLLKHIRDTREDNQETTSLNPSSSAPKKIVSEKNNLDLLVTNVKRKSEKRLQKTNKRNKNKK